MKKPPCLIKLKTKSKHPSVCVCEHMYVYNLYMYNIICHAGAKVYEQVKRTREDERNKRNMMCEVLQYVPDDRACQQWLHKLAAM